MHILVASKNLAKINAVETAFGTLFPEWNCTCEGVSVPSGVPDQPFGEETFLGAKQRLHNLENKAKEQAIAYDFLVSLEGGISSFLGDWYCYAAAMVISKEGQTGHGTSPMYPLPQELMEEVEAGRELGKVLIERTGDPNAKQRGGTIGLLSKDRIKRADLLAQGVQMALIPLLNPSLWKK